MVSSNISAAQTSVTGGSAYTSADIRVADIAASRGLAVGVVETLEEGGEVQTVVNNISFPSLPVHHIYLLSDSSNPVALHLHDVLKSTFRVDTYLPVRG